MRPLRAKETKYLKSAPLGQAPETSANRTHFSLGITDLNFTVLGQTQENMSARMRTNG